MPRNQIDWWYGWLVLIVLIVILVIYGLKKWFSIVMFSYLKLYQVSKVNSL